MFQISVSDNNDSKLKETLIEAAVVNETEFDVTNVIITSRTWVVNNDGDGNIIRQRITAVLTKKTDKNCYLEYVFFMQM